MDFKELIKARRSIRKYDSSKTVSEEQIQNILDAVIQAPSWKNSQTGRYHCVISKDMVQKISAECLPEFNRKNSEGAAYIVASFVKDHSGFDKDGNPTNECGNGWGYYDLGLECENLVLAAKNEGLDTLIMGIRDSDKIRTLLGIPDNEIIVSVIAIGYAAMEPQLHNRKTPNDISVFY